jgi:hypothetical protein
MQLCLCPNATFVSKGISGRATQSIRRPCGSKMRSMRVENASRTSSSGATHSDRNVLSDAKLAQIYASDASLRSDAQSVRSHLANVSSGPPDGDPGLMRLLNRASRHHFGSLPPRNGDASLGARLAPTSMHEVMTMTRVSRPSSASGLYKQGRTSHLLPH